MGILHRGEEHHEVPRLDFELTASCDHKCGHCYNVWGAKEDDPQGLYPKGQLRTPAFLEMMEKAVRQSGADHITITGGEPLLRKSAVEVVERACELVSSVQVITNGSHVTPEVARRFGAAGVRAVQLTLLSADPAKHDHLKGAECFEDTVRSAVRLREAGVPVQVCFVAMRANWYDFEEVIELCHVLGVRMIAYNRMSPTGAAVHEIAELLPELGHVQANLETAEVVGRRLGVHVSTAMPIPPCLFRLERTPWVQFGFCSTGTESPNLTIDAMGKVRSCNLSSGILGDLTQEDWPAIHERIERYQSSFKRTLPTMCQGCAYAAGCQGGCKESAFATFGSLDAVDPFIRLATDAAWRDEITQSFECPGAALGLRGDAN